MTNYSIRVPLLINPKQIFGKHLIVIFGLLFINNLKAQTFEFLKNKWLHDKSDTARVNAGLLLDRIYYFDRNELYQAQNKLLLEIYNASKAINYDIGIIESSYRLGQNYTFQTNGSKAIEYFFISLKKSEQSNKLNFIARSKMGIGLIYYSQNNWLKAIEFFKGSLIINKKIKQERMIATQQYLIAASLSANSDFINARLYLDSAYLIKLKIKDSSGINECKLVMGDIFKGLNQIDSAFYYYQSLLPIFIKQKESIPISFIYSSMADIWYSRAKYNIAHENAKKAYYYSTLIPYPLPKLKACEILYKINKALKDYKTAIIYFDEYNLFKDSIENNDFAAEISVAQVTHDFEKEQAALKTEQEKKELKYDIELKNITFKQYILSAIAIISLLFVIIIIFAYRTVSKQKKISEDLLLNILPKETVNELKKFGKSIPKNHKEVTIMFSDIKNFSHIAESLTPENVVEMLDTYFKQFDIILEKYGVEKIKTIGDAYMCVGGLSENDLNPAYNTLLVAFEFLKFNEIIASEMMDKYGHSFNFRIGIHTGNVVSGVVGLKKYSYDVWGDAVNIAARMEQSSIPGMINISGSTYNLVKNHHSLFEHRGQLPIKNLGKIDMYFALQI